MHKPPTSKMAHRLQADASKAVRYAVILAALILAPLAVAACSSSPGGSVATPVSQASPAPPSPRTGQQIFVSTCAVCHGAAGQGQPNWHIPKEDGVLPAPPLDGTGHTWHHPDGWLFRVVSQGGKIQESASVPNFKSGMPAFGDSLSDKEIIETLTYVKSLWEGKTSRSGLSIVESQAYVSERDPFPTVAD